MSSNYKKLTHPFLANRDITFKRRIGPDPHADGMKTVALNECPDLWETESGDFAVIGIRITDQVANRLPSSAGCGPDEEIVLIPRRLLLDVKSSIPDSL